MTATGPIKLVPGALAGNALEATYAHLPGKAKLRDELDLASMDFLNVGAALHERTKIDIHEADCRTLFTLDGAVAYLHRWLDERTGVEPPFPRRRRTADDVPAAVDQSDASCTRTGSRPVATAASGRALPGWLSYRPISL